jgi:uncharacterized membrane protein (UPF0127 family)
MDTTVSLYQDLIAFIFPYQPQNYKTFIKLKAPLTTELKQRGLMFLDEIPEHAGMIFYNKDAFYMNMTMKNTKIPLDMIFVKNNIIDFIWRNTTPFDDRTVYTSSTIVDYVIEVNAGFCQKYKIKEGDKVFLRVYPPEL